MSLASLMNETLTIYEASGGSDGQGGFVNTFTSVGTTDARLWVASPSEKNIGDKWDATVTHSIVVPITTSITRNNYVLDSNGYYYRVVAGAQPSTAGSNMNHKKFVVEEIQANNSSIID